MLQDLRYGARMLRANPGFTLVVVLSLAAGIGANSAIFSIANAMLLKTMPIAEPDHLYVVRYQSRLPVTPRVSYPFFDQLRAGFPGARRAGGDEPRGSYAPGLGRRAAKRVRPAGDWRILSTCYISRRKWGASSQLTIIGRSADIPSR